MSSQATKTIKTSNDTCSSNDRTKNKRPRIEDADYQDAGQLKEEDGLLEIQESTNVDDRCMMRVSTSKKQLATLPYYISVRDQMEEGYGGLERIKISGLHGCNISFTI